MTAETGIAIGFLGAAYVLVLLFYTTGILINFTRFQNTDILPYTERLRSDSSFHVLLLATVLSALGLGTAGLLHILGHPSATAAIVTALIPFLTGFLYFVRRMHTISRPQ